MIPISIEDFTKLYVKNNEGENEKEVIENLRKAVVNKKEGAKCEICDKPIWAIGSATTFDGCFTCVTGEVDDSEDYEIDEVLY